MNRTIFVLALTLLIGISCKHKQDAENKPPSETPQSPTQKPEEPKPQGHHHHDDDDDDDNEHEHHGHKHHRLPPGQEKKLHGDQSARDYAPGHRDK